MRKLGLSLSFVVALSIAGVALSQQPEPSLPVPGAASGASSGGPTVVTDQKFQIGQRIRAAREARASRKSGRGHLLGRRRQQGNNVTPPALPAPAQR